METEKVVKTTKDYSIFKKLEGNRPVANRRINKIIASIQNVGYITSPLIVNEKMEVIDGQGRLEALKQLGLPVEYIVHPGIGINECIAMNINQGNWSLKDYIESYSVRGNKSYQRLEQLIKGYPLANLDVIATAALRVNKITGTMVKDGSLVLTEEKYNKAKERLDYAYEIFDLIDKTTVKGGLLNLVQVMLYCYDYETGNTEKISDKNIADYFVDTDNETLYYFVIDKGLYSRKLSESDSKMLYNADDTMVMGLLSYDGKNIYMYNGGIGSVSDLRNQIDEKIFVLNTDGTCVNTISLDSEKMGNLYYGDDKYIFFSYSQKLAYVDKKNIMNNVEIVTVE